MPRTDRSFAMLLFVAVWTVIAVLAATTSFIALGGSSVEEWLFIFGHMLAYFYAWAVISIAIYWLVHRDRDRDSRLFVQLVQHLAFLFAITVSLPVILHASNWQSWLYGERAIGFHSLNAFIYSFVLIGSMLVIYYRTVRLNEAAAHAAQIREIELQRSLEKSRMEALRAQINPHFLFNALNSIAALVETSANREAYDLIARVAELLRNALDFSRDSLVTVADELRFLDAYLAIEKVRYADRIEVTRDVQEACLDLDVPSFSLQPLVENVIKHVVSKSTEPVAVRVEVSRQGEQLVLRVIDDGAGIDGPVQAGVGLGNIRERMHYLFAEQACVEIRNGSAGGTVAELTLPAQATVASMASAPAAAVRKEKQRYESKLLRTGHLPV